jgi:hypothetical protein
MRHIAILGPPGSGKSWLARRLGDALDIPVVHLDNLYWKPGWVPTPETEWEARQRSEVERESWIAEGLQEARTMPHLWLDTADTIVLLDTAPLSSLRRIARRRLASMPGPEGPADCKPAPFHRALPKVLRSLWVYRGRVRREMLDELDRRRGGQRVQVLRGDDEAQRFVDDAKAHRDALGESLLM